MEVGTFFLKGTSGPKSATVLGIVIKSAGGTLSIPSQPQEQQQGPTTIMESVLTASSSPTGRVTFSRVFGQQCQLMEAGRRWPESGKQSSGSGGLSISVCVHGSV